MNDPLVYLSGQLKPASQAHLAIFDAGIVLGATVRGGELTDEPVQNRSS